MFGCDAKTVLLAVLITTLLVPNTVCAVSTGNLVFKWEDGFDSSIGGLYAGDYDRDGEVELLVGLYSNNIVVYNGKGVRNESLYLGDPSRLGKIYSLDVRDLDEDGLNEFIVGFGGLRVDRTYSPHDWIVVNTSDGNQELVRINKVLYKTLRYMGSVDAYDMNLSLVWTEPTENSVRSVFVGDADSDNRTDVLFGTGDIGVNTYNVLIGTEDGKEVWNLTEEELTEGVIYLVSAGGGLEFKVNITPPLRDHYPEDFNNNVRAVVSGDLYPNDNIMNVLVGSENGFVYAYDINLTNYTLSRRWTYNVSTGVRDIGFMPDPDELNRGRVIVGDSRNTVHMLDQDGKLLWKSRLDGVVSDISIVDMDYNGFDDIVVASTDMNIYIFNKDGSIRWKYYVGKPIYGLLVYDLDGNGFNDFVTVLDKNLSVYELSESYTKIQQANMNYFKSEEAYLNGDYVSAMIYVQKAKSIYYEIEAFDEVPKCDLLIGKINVEIKRETKEEANRDYALALRYYGSNNHSLALVYAGEAKKLYAKIYDEDGVSKATALENRIRVELIETTRMLADSHYSKALNYYSFANYNATLYNVRAARELYVNISYFNETVKCDSIIAQVADVFYERADLYYKSLSYELSMQYALTSQELYLEAGYFNGSMKSELLIKDIEAKMNESTDGQGGDRNMLVYGAIAALVVGLIILLALKKRRESDEDMVY